MAKIAWRASMCHVGYRREITAIAGNTLTLDLPLAEAIAANHGGGRVCTCAHTGRIF